MAQQRANISIISNGQDTAQPRATRTTKQFQQDGLGLVIGLMAQCNFVGLYLIGNTVQELVTHLP